MASDPPQIDLEVIGDELSDSALEALAELLVVLAEEVEQEQEQEQET